VFLGGLLLTLVVGLVWALTPSKAPAPRSGQPTPTQLATASPNPTPSPVPTTVEKAPPTTAAATRAAALIAAAEPPESTTLQVLDAGGGRERRYAAAAELSALGYRVMSTASARQHVLRTTIWFTSGNEAKALALQARDPRFAYIAPSAGLSARVDLHILVGPDWE
jgi:hypothetical protein